MAMVRAIRLYCNERSTPFMSGPRVLIVVFCVNRQSQEGLGMATVCQCAPDRDGLGQGATLAMETREAQLRGFRATRLQTAFGTIEISTLQPPAADTLTIGVK